MCVLFLCHSTFFLIACEAHLNKWYNTTVSLEKGQEGSWCVSQEPVSYLGCHYHVP